MGKKVLKNVYNSDDISLSYFSTGFLNLEIFKKIQLFCVTEFLAESEKEIFMYYFEQDKFKFIIINNKGITRFPSNNFNYMMIINNKFDYYKIKLIN